MRDLDAYPFDLSTWQVCEYLERHGVFIDQRTLGRWLKIGFVHGYLEDLPKRGEWRIPKHSVRLLLARKRPAA